jgi:hypothetical protein
MDCKAQTLMLLLIKNLIVHSSEVWHFKGKKIIAGGNGFLETTGKIIRERQNPKLCN